MPRKTATNCSLLWPNLGFGWSCGQVVCCISFSARCVNGCGTPSGGAHSLNLATGHWGVHRLPTLFEEDTRHEGERVLKRHLHRWLCVSNCDGRSARTEEYEASV